MTHIHALTYGGISLVLLILTACSDPQRPVPSVLGMDLGTATLQIQGASFQMGVVDRKFVGSNGAPGTIVAQSPPPGTLTRPGTSIQITIDDYRVVPNLSGMSQMDARQYLENSGLQLALASDREDLKSADSIRRQTPSAGSKVAAGSMVSVWLTTSDAKRENRPPTNEPNETSPDSFPHPEDFDHGSWVDKARKTIDLVNRLLPKGTSKADNKSDSTNLRPPPPPEELPGKKQNAKEETLQAQIKDVSLLTKREKFRAGDKIFGKYLIFLSLEETVRVTVEPLFQGNVVASVYKSQDLVMASKKIERQFWFTSKVPGTAIDSIRLTVYRDTEILRQTIQPIDIQFMADPKSVPPISVAPVPGESKPVLKNPHTDLSGDPIKVSRSKR